MAAARGAQEVGLAGAKGAAAAAMSGAPLSAPRCTCLTRAEEAPRPCGPVGAGHGACTTRASCVRGQPPAGPRGDCRVGCDGLRTRQLAMACRHRLRSPALVVGGATAPHRAANEKLRERARESDDERGWRAATPVPWCPGGVGAARPCGSRDARLRATCGTHALETMLFHFGCGMC
eukprot:3715219-Prymnesium_polylepis.1